MVSRGIVWLLSGFGRVLYNHPLMCYANVLFGSDWMKRLFSFAARVNPRNHGVAVAGETRTAILAAHDTMMTTTTALHDLKGAILTKTPTIPTPPVGGDTQRPMMTTTEGAIRHLDLLQAAEEGGATGRRKDPRASKEARPQRELVQSVKEGEKKANGTLELKALRISRLFKRSPVESLVSPVNRGIWAAQVQSSEGMPLVKPSFPSLSLRYALGARTAALLEPTAALS